MEREPKQDIRDSFKINWMNMSSVGKELWRQDFSNANLFGGDAIKIEIPKEVLEKPQISREINFSSKCAIKHLRLVQHILLHGNIIEQWNFDFGFVIPGSTNTWQNTVEAGDDVIPAEVLSGNVCIETKFFDATELIGTCSTLVYYV